MPEQDPTSIALAELEQKTREEKALSPDLVDVRPFLAYICPSCRNHLTMSKIHRSLDTPEGREAEFRAMVRDMPHRPGCPEAK